MAPLAAAAAKANEELDVTGIEESADYKNKRE